MQGFPAKVEVLAASAAIVADRLFMLNGDPHPCGLLSTGFWTGVIIDSAQHTLPLPLRRGIGIPGENTLPDPSSTPILEANSSKPSLGSSFPRTSMMIARPATDVVTSSGAVTAVVFCAKQVELNS